jgi:hypothetical protein
VRRPRFVVHVAREEHAGEPVGGISIRSISRDRAGHFIELLERRSVRSVPEDHGALPLSTFDAGTDHRRH